MPVLRDTSTMTESVNFSDGPAREATSTKAYSKYSSAHPSPKDTSTEVDCVSSGDLTDSDPMITGFKADWKYSDQYEISR